MENLYGLEKLNEVWDRVTASSGKTSDAANGTVKRSSSSAEDILRNFIQNEVRSNAGYRTMAMKSSSRSTKMFFMRLANEEYRHLKKLQKRYFLLTGDSFNPKPANIKITSMLSALRNSYTAEIKAQNGYERAALSSQDSKLSQLYSELALDEARHASEIERMIEKVIG